MRMIKLVFAFVLVAGFGASAFAGEKDAPKPGDEKAADQSGTQTGMLYAPSKEAPRGTVAELHQPAPGGAKGEETVFYLFADGGVARQLRDLANRGSSATVTGIVTKEGYRVTSISNVQKGK